MTRDERFDDYKIMDLDRIGYREGGAWLTDLKKLEKVFSLYSDLICLGISENAKQVAKKDWDHIIRIVVPDEQIDRRIATRLKEKKNTYGEFPHEVLEIRRCNGLNTFALIGEVSHDEYISTDLESDLTSVLDIMYDDPELVA